MTDALDPDRFFGKPEEYLAWTAKNKKFNPLFCPRHWMPCPVERKPGMLVQVILMVESFGYMPDDLVKPGIDPASAMNSWMANQIIPLCCKIGNEKMDWLWWVVTVDQEKLCREPYPEAGVSIRVCWRLKNHEGEHEWERPMPRSTFDLMEEVNRRTVK